MLSDGGARRFTHLGTFKAIEEQWYPSRYTFGYQVGSLMAILYADGYTADEPFEMTIAKNITIAKIENVGTISFKE